LQETTNGLNQKQAITDNELTAHQNYIDDNARSIDELRELLKKLEDKVDQDAFDEEINHLKEILN